MSISQANPDQLRPSGDGDENLGPTVQIGPARRAEAIQRLVSTGCQTDRTAAERFLYYARTNAVRLDGLWSRLGPDDGIAYTVLAVPSPGRTAMVFASHPRTADEIPPIGGLIEHACRQVTGWDVELAQALLEPAEALEREAFLSAGFIELARLSYLERSLTRAPGAAAPQWPDNTRIEPYRDEHEPMLINILDQSYEQTLDCPGLYGLRRTQDILAGHKATGKFDGAMWTLLWLDDKPAGAILLNPFPAHKTIELVYLGLAAFARGRGLGRQLLRHGLAVLSGRRERSLTLAVDQRNTPALALYESEGFHPIVHRVAMIKSLAGALV